MRELPSDDRWEPPAGCSVCACARTRLCPCLVRVKLIRTKHIDAVRYHYIRQCVQRNQAKVVWIPTVDMVADILTKFSCSASQHYALAVKMMGGRYK